jgi:bifunctional ADP-heptose synthase (sugar kinase/adenylyltransferase)
VGSILVIGESCQDEFVYCDAERLAPDLPIPILKIREIKTNPGMAMNVLCNIGQLITGSEILTNGNWEQVRKTRYVDYKTNHTFIRIDSADIIEPVRFESFETLHEYELILISDYNKGFLTKELMEKIATEHSNVFLDTKKILGNWAANFKFIKINDHEFQRSLPFVDEQLMAKIIHTRGAEGTNFQGKNFSVESVDVQDSTGAGDSFFAALAVNYLESNDIEKSIVFANKEASKVVSKKGVTLIG